MPLHNPSFRVTITALSGSVIYDFQTFHGENVVTTKHRVAKSLGLAMWRISLCHDGALLDNHVLLESLLKTEAASQVLHLAFIQTAIMPPVVLENTEILVQLMHLSNLCNFSLISTRLICESRVLDYRAEFCQFSPSCVDIDQPLLHEALSMRRAHLHYWKQPKDEDKLLVMRWLLMSGSQVDVVRDGQQPLHLACALGNPTLAQLLIAHHADINALTAEGKTPLHIACQLGNVAVVHLLMKYRAEVGLFTSDGKTPLHIVFNNNRTLARLLIEHHADVNAVMTEGTYFLHNSCMLGDGALAQLMIAHNADLNALTTEGQTPLQCALQYFTQKKPFQLIHNDYSLAWACCLMRRHLDKVHAAVEYDDVSLAEARFHLSQVTIELALFEPFKCALNKQMVMLRSPLPTRVLQSFGKELWMGWPWAFLRLNAEAPEYRLDPDCFADKWQDCRLDPDFLEVKFHVAPDFGWDDLVAGMQCTDEQEKDEFHDCWIDAYDQYETWSRKWYPCRWVDVAASKTASAVPFSMASACPGRREGRSFVQQKRREHYRWHGAFASTMNSLDSTCASDVSMAGQGQTTLLDEYNTHKTRNQKWYPCRSARRPTRVPFGTHGYSNMSYSSRLARKLPKKSGQKHAAWVRMASEHEHDDFHMTLDLELHNTPLDIIGSLGM